MDELLEALAIEISEDDDVIGSDDTDSDESDEDSTEVDCPERISPIDVIECCKSLVIHEVSGLVRFSHETVKVFIGNCLIKELLPEIELAKCCLAYLESPEFQQPVVSREAMEMLVENFKFCSYAISYWRSHICKEAENSYDLQYRILRGFESRSKRNAKSGLECFVRHWYFGFRLDSSLLHVLTNEGLSILCKRLLDGSRNRYN
jgi:hypothetical protein